MALHYQIVFGVMIFEMAYLLFLSLPLPTALRRSVLRMTHTASELPQVKYTVSFGCLVVFVLFLDALNVAYKINSEKNFDSLQSKPSAAQIATAAMRDRSTDSYINAKMFYAQRNLYLTGGVLFLAIVLSRFHSLISQLIKAEDALSAVTFENEKSRELYSKLSKNSVPKLPTRSKKEEVAEDDLDLQLKENKLPTNDASDSGAPFELRNVLDASVDFASSQVDKINKAYHRLASKASDDRDELPLDNLGPTAEAKKVI